MVGARRLPVSAALMKAKTGTRSKAGHPSLQSGGTNVVNGNLANKNSVQSQLRKPPTPPKFELQPLTTEAQIKEFWSTYPIIVNQYNVRAVMYWRKAMWYRRNLKGSEEDCYSGIMNDTTWQSRLVDITRTNFKTNKFIVTQKVHPDLFKPGYIFDITGPVGNLDYYIDKDEDIQFNSDDESYKYEDMIFKLWFFNYFERSAEYKGVLSSGYRIQFTNVDLENSFFSVAAEPYISNTRLSIQFHMDGKEIPKIVTFLVPGTIKPERVNTYPYVNKDGSFDIFTDIPIPSKVISNCLNKITGKYEGSAEISITKTAITTRNPPPLPLQHEC